MTEHLAYSRCNLAHSSASQQVRGCESKELLGLISNLIKQKKQAERAVPERRSGDHAGRAATGGAANALSVSA